MPTRRTVRVAEVLRKELSACMSQCLQLENLLITISAVELPPDLKQAYIYVSTIFPDIDLNHTLAVLNNNRREWQSRIGKRLGLKFTPQLIFRFDKSVERGDRIMEILTELELSPVGKDSPDPHPVLPLEGDALEAGSAWEEREEEGNRPAQQDLEKFPGREKKTGSGRPSRNKK